jgi:hypothetical protein
MQGEGVSPNKFTFVQVIAGLGTLEDGRLVLSSLFKLVASLMSFWEYLVLTCMQSVGALSRLGECSTGCHL